MHYSAFRWILLWVFYPLFITILKQTYFFSAFPGMVCFWLTFYYITVNVGV